MTKDGSLTCKITFGICTLIGWLCLNAYIIVCFFKSIVHEYLYIKVEYWNDIKYGRGTLLCIYYLSINNGNCLTEVRRAIKKLISLIRKGPALYDFRMMEKWLHSFYILKASLVILCFIKWRNTKEYPQPLTKTNLGLKSVKIISLLQLFATKFFWKYSS